ncbi:MAG TPA: YfiR family protein [Candidatus Aquilonibacter sp.]|nr:YfiR family protein [Candidatus Aquilonibacter sp.]
MDTLITIPGIAPRRRSAIHPYGMKGRQASAFFCVREWAPSLISLIFLLALAATPLAAQQKPTEAQVKAAYLYNFGKFVTWQNDADANVNSLNICVLGKDPFGTILDATVAGESIGGKQIIIKRLAKIQDGPDCRILFVSSSEEKRLRSILQAAQTSGMLTVSSISTFLQQGGVIEFVTEGDRIRFAVNLNAAQQSHLALSSQLLKVASQVIDSGKPQSQE